MRLRRFTGADPRAALARVKETLGPEAVILATRALDGGGVEITAAVDLDAVHAAAADAAPAARVESAELTAITRELAAMAARVARIDRTLAQALAAEGSDLDDEARALAERLALHGTAPALAEAAARSFAAARRDGTPAAAALAASLARHLTPTKPPAAARVTAFVGPTGSGKTTTIAKLAARAAAGGASVGLVMADTYRIGAAEQLGTYARLLGVPMRAVRDGGELAAALAGFVDRDVVYVDTAGLTGDPGGAAQIGRLFAAADTPIRTTAVVPASASDAALRRAWRQLGALVPTAGVVTKLDEGAGLGTACTWLADVGVPVAWLGTGTRVPDDLAAADGETLAAWLAA